MTQKSLPDGKISVKIKYGKFWEFMFRKCTRTRMSQYHRVVFLINGTIVYKILSLLQVSLA